MEQVNRQLCFFAAFLTLSLGKTFLMESYGQGKKERTVEAYYLDINKASKQVIHELQEQNLNLQYQDIYGQWPELTLRIFNWKREELANYQMAKSYGINYFQLNLGKIFASWPLNEMYSCRLSDESGHVYEFLVKKIPVPEMTPPKVSILVNPLQTDCDKFTTNIVEFYGQIEGGKAPYQIHWYVLNEERTNFLYQPREETIEKAGKSMVIQVDKAPSYYVLLNVKDACGSEQQKIIHLTCDKQKEVVNTLFIEPLRRLPKNREQ